MSGGFLCGAPPFGGMHEPGNRCRTPFAFMNMTWTLKRLASMGVSARVRSAAASVIEYRPLNEVLEAGLRRKEKSVTVERLAHRPATQP